MPDSPNPFAPQPESPQPSGAPHPSGMPPRTGGAGMLGVVPVLSALLIVLGALELLYAVAVGGVLTAGVFVQAGSGLPAELAGQIIAVAIFAGVGFIGLLRIAAAVGGLKYRGWGTMMTACCLGLATVFTCYCAPFSLVVGVLGVVVLADSHVRRAFAMAQDGTAPADIRRIITGQSQVP